ncbi:glycoside hydrolase family 71/99-like protein [Rubellicoccus peritrichatus]|uniref:Glycoside hydrolase family 71/99-like protein n=1 Tax=Rubellicoccus peritrichatus TaxID=3080537 RepID=A0AAQ3L9A8_9BACT|nr:glycoside hydrolase family 71/99-like protein [Puniceicoccus sp. CR14]WOO39670.1 glycoside hydrolase family 71/99-like protein [Puniceicoccus sp. CR14]
MLKYLRKCLVGTILFLGIMASYAEEEASLHGVASSMRPYTGIHVPGVSTTTLKGKVMCGYQGWFAAKGDGSGRGWVHFGPGGHFAPGECTIDLWPDMSEMDLDEKYPTSFRHQDGKTAYVFSSYNWKTVMRHFRWMQEHGIDGVFLQRFGASVRRQNAMYDHRNVVTSNVQAGANRYGRTWAMMYDLSGLRAGEIEKVVIEDWKRLVDRMKITSDKSYLHHKGKPVVAVWGIGFGDDRKYTLDECEKLVKFLKNDKQYGGNTVMLGVPTYWRSLSRDSVSDKALHDIILQADIVSPWTVGRYGSLQQVGGYAKDVLGPDIEWTKQNNFDYLPVAFPGFSWQNLQKTRGKDVKLNQIPRLDGQFLWSQAASFKQAGAEMLYVAMFDELDEGTAIFKCTNDPPVGESHFVTYEGLQSDHYLWLTGRIGELLRSESNATANMPIRNTQQDAEGDAASRTP